MNIQFFKKINLNIMIYANKTMPSLLMVVLIVTFGISLSAQRVIPNMQSRTSVVELPQNKGEQQANLKNKQVQDCSNKQVPVFKLTKLYENNVESINAYKAQLLKQQETATATEKIQINNKIVLLDKNIQQLNNKNKNLPSSEKKVRKPRKHIVEKAFTNPVFYSND